MSRTREEHEKRDAEAWCSYADERPICSWILVRQIAVNQLETIEMEDILEPQASPPSDGASPYVYTHHLMRGNSLVSNPRIE